MTEWDDAASILHGTEWATAEVPEPVDFGPCCACGRGGPEVRNVMLLHQLAPIPGHGWGCLQCGLAPDGAVAVVCDDCLDGDEPLTLACRGYPATEGRVPIGELVGTFEHDLRLHPEVDAA